VTARVRRIEVFFYGLFMDVELLRSKGMRPKRPRRATVRGYSLRIGRRATLVPDPQGRVHGLVVTLSHGEIDQLYSEEGVRSYRPEAVLCELDDAPWIPALCFNLVDVPSQSERNPEYVQQVRDLVARLLLPKDYVAEISALASEHTPLLRPSPNRSRRSRPNSDSG
jgi:hypothetical protein